MITIAKAEEFLYIYFITPKCSTINGKATHFEKNPRTSGCYYLVRDNVTLVVNVEFIEERETQESIWNEQYRAFLKKKLMIQNSD